MALRHMLLLTALLLMLIGVCRCVFGQDDPCELLWLAGVWLVSSLVVSIGVALARATEDREDEW